MLELESYSIFLNFLDFEDLLERRDLLNGVQKLLIENNGREVADQWSRKGDLYFFLFTTLQVWKR